MLDQIQSQKITSIDSTAHAKEFKAKLKQIKLFSSKDGLYIQSLELEYSDTKTFLFEEEEEKIIYEFQRTIEISDQEYLKRVLYKTDQGYITQISFTINNPKNQERLEVFGANDSIKYESKKFEASIGNQLTGFKCEKSKFLMSVTCHQDLLPQFQPVALVKTVINNQQRVVNNYYEIKLLQQQIPSLNLIEDSSAYKD